MPSSRTRQCKQDAEVRKIYIPHRRADGLPMKLVTVNGATYRRVHNLPLYRSTDLRLATRVLGTRARCLYFGSVNDI